MHLINTGVAPLFSKLLWAWALPASPLPTGLPTGSHFLSKSILHILCLSQPSLTQADLLGEHKKIVANTPLTPSFSNYLIIYSSIAILRISYEMIRKMKVTSKS